MMLASSLKYLYGDHDQLNNDTRRWLSYMLCRIFIVILITVGFILREHICFYKQKLKKFTEACKTQRWACETSKSDLSSTTKCDPNHN